ncbi:MAG: N-acetylmuramoyl-L-alanine amidase [Gammaproteobacteria bacterium]
MRRIIGMFLFLCLPWWVYAAEPARLTGMHIQPSPDNTCILFYLTKKTFGNVKYTPRPDTLTVDFANTTKQFNIEQAKLVGSNVISINAKQLSATHLRFSFMVRHRVKWKVNFLTDENRVVMQLDILSISHLPVKATQANLTTPSKLENDIQQTLKELSAQKIGRQRLEDNASKKIEIFTVVIDAGHGGKDSGALGSNGIKEKNVVLGIARKLADEINQQPGMRAVLTRSGDYFVPLRQRLRLARKGEGDLFVAIHADAYFNSRAIGASVYALSQHGATSEAARWLAQKDNYSELDGVEFNSLQDRSPLLRSVLIDLAQTATIRDSLRLGNKVLDALDNISTLHYKHVEQAPFMVLKSPDIPSILVETGFISNPREERRLADPRYQQRVARALLVGIQQYKDRYAGM